MKDHMHHDFNTPMSFEGSDSKKWMTYPPDTIPMWIADTDFACPQPIIDAVTLRAQRGIFGYPLENTGMANATQQWMQQRFGWDIDESWVHFAHAVLPALATAVQALTEKGEKVLIQSPVYPPFHSIIETCGRVKVTSPLQRDEQGIWRMDFADIEKKCSDPAVRLFLLCNPHNPTGRAFSRQELMELCAICLKHKVRIVADEIHSDIVYPDSPHKHIPLPTLSETISENCIVLINPCKTFNIPGLRCAASITPNTHLREKLAQQTVVSRGGERSIFGPLAYEVAYTQCGYYADQLIQYLHENVLFALQYFATHIPAIRVSPPNATYMLWLDCQALAMPTQKDLHSFFLSQAKVALSNGEDFGTEGKGFMRMNIACTKHTLKKALDRIRHAVSTQQ